MKEVKLNFGSVDVVLTKPTQLVIYRDGKETILNCTTSEMMKFLTDSIDMMMEHRR
jgi:glycerophosphoryl diester phosphodiesterase